MGVNEKVRIFLYGEKRKLKKWKRKRVLLQKTFHGRKRVAERKGRRWFENFIG